jgi:hypothetical protein
VSKLKTITLTIVISALFLSSFYHLTNPIEASLDADDAAIDKIKLESNGTTMYLNVFLNHPLSCKQVITILGIEKVPVKTKVYLPVCTVIRDNYIKIKFEEEVIV